MKRCRLFVGLFGTAEVVGRSLGSMGALLLFIGPFVGFVLSLAFGEWPGNLVDVTGYVAASFLGLALSATPVSLIRPHSSVARWLRGSRRALGIAAYAYAFGHLVLYVADMETLSNVLRDLAALGILLGWAAFFLLTPLFLTSNDFSVRHLGAKWKALHKAAYPAMVLVFLHWAFVHDNVVMAIVFMAPLLLMEIHRVSKNKS